MKSDASQLTSVLFPPYSRYFKQRVGPRHVYSARKNNFKSVNFVDM